MQRLRPEAAEAVGTAFILLAGGGAILAGADAFAVAATFGATVAVLVYALGHVCGAHFNPAITVAFAATGHFPWARVPGYVLAQLLGATAGAAALLLVADDVAPVAAALRPGLDPFAAVAIEALATFLLAFVIVAVATDRRAAQGLAGVAIGLAVFVGSLWAGPFTGAAMNPARALGPDAVAGTWQDAWVHLVGPLLGAIAAMAFYQWLRPASKPVPGETLGALGPVADREAA